jgi:hypothetical protein
MSSARPIRSFSGMSAKSSSTEATPMVSSMAARSASVADV